MKITNKLGASEAIYRFLTYDSYDYEAVKGTLSATTFNKSTREIVLTQRHWNEIESEAMDRLWSVFGSAVHSVLEKVQGAGIEPLGRLYAEIEGQRVSGKFDLIKDNKVYDFKVTSAWTLVYGSRVKEWTLQLSIYRWLFNKSTTRTLSDKGTIIALLRDWTDKHIATRNYPQAPIVEVDIQLLSFQETEAELTSKIRELNLVKDIADNDLPNCSDLERWWNTKTQTFAKCQKYCQAYAFCSQANPEVGIQSATDQLRELKERMK